MATHTHRHHCPDWNLLSLLARIAPAPLDHTGRTNLFAHHVVLDGSEMPEGGPAWLFQHADFRMESDFHGAPRYLQARQPPCGGSGETPPLRPARTWKAVTGDEGWAGVLAERFEQEPQHPVYLIFEPGFDPLPLLAEALALLPPERRWDVTFSTYFTPLPPGVTCAWRCVPRGSQEAKAVLRLPDTLNLCVPLGRAPASALVEAARTGRRPAKGSPRWHTPPRPVAMHPTRARSASDGTPDTSPERQRRDTGESEPGRAAGRLAAFLGGLVLGALLMFGAALALWYLPGTRQHEEVRAERDELEQQCAERDAKIGSLEKALADRRREVEARDKKMADVQEVFKKSTLPEGVRAELSAVVKEPARGTRQVEERMTGWAVGLMSQAVAAEKERLTRGLETALEQQKFQGAPLPLDRRLLARDPGRAVAQTIAGLEKRSAQRRPDVRDQVLFAIKQALHENRQMVSEIDYALREEKLAQHLRGIGATFKKWYDHRLEAEAPAFVKWLDAQDSYRAFLHLKADPDVQKSIPACERTLRLCDEILKNSKSDLLAHRKARAVVDELDQWLREHDREKWSQRHPS